MSRTGNEGTPTKQLSCHWSRHLGGCEYVVYDLLSRLLWSRGMSEITISSRHLANMTVYGKNSIAAALRALEEAGWINRYVDHNGVGRWKPDTFVVVSHEDWAKKHPGRCRIH